MKAKKTAAKIGHDLLLCLLAGLAAAAATGGIGALLGLCLYGDDVPLPPLQGAVSGLLVVGALTMLCSAFFFSKRTRKEDSNMQKFWNQKFHIFSYQVGFLVISVIVLLIGCGLDVVLRSVT